MFLTVGLLLLLVIQDQPCLGYLPVNTAKVAGHPLMFSCEAHSGDSFVLWKFQPIGHSEAEILFNGYNISKDRPRFFISSSRPGQFNLANSDTHLEDAGSYHCIQRNVEQGSYRTETGIAQLTVLASVPICASNASSQGIVEGDQLRMWCSVHYLGNLDPVMEWSRDGGSIADSNVIYTKASDPFTLTATASEMMMPNDHNATYICKTFFKTPAALDPEKSDTFTARNAPDFIDECKLTISVLFGPRNMSITPRKNTYTKGDQIICSASANPPPKYSWKDAENEHAGDEPFLKVDDKMEQRRTNTYRCTAENIIAGERKTSSETIAFNVAATAWDTSSGRSLIVIVGAGAAVGGIAITVVGVMLKKLAQRKCHVQPKENESADRRGSPHDYESVNSGDMDSTQQTPDIEMDQSSIMANQTVEQSMTETEEDLTVAETLNHYDTLDDFHTMQETRPYSALEAPNSEDQINRAKDRAGKPNDYYNIDMNIVVSEQDIQSI